MSEDRRLMVLRAIVQDYVQTSEPVGSKALVERHHLGVSAATVRNDMALLEEEGLIHAPHTSAGRVPTDAGYRVFVDRLSAVKPLGQGERRAIGQFLEGAVDLDDVVDRTVRLLASLTRQVAVVQYPSLTRSTVRHIELVPMGSSHLMIVLIVNTGRVEQRVVDTGRVLSRRRPVRRWSPRSASRINEVAAGVPFTVAATRLRRLVDDADEADRAADRGRRLRSRRRPRRGARGARRPRRAGEPRPGRRRLPPHASDRSSRPSRSTSPCCACSASSATTPSWSRCASAPRTP